MPLIIEDENKVKKAITLKNGNKHSKSLYILDSGECFIIKEDSYVRQWNKEINSNRTALYYEYDKGEHCFYFYLDDKNRKMSVVFKSIKKLSDEDKVEYLDIILTGEI